MPLPSKFKRPVNPVEVKEKVSDIPPPVNSVVDGTVVSPREITLDEVGAHLKDLEDYAMTFLGKENCNPFMWRLEVIEPLLFEIKEHPSQELFERILKIQKTKPTV